MKTASISPITLLKTLPVANTLGESVVWNPDDECVWWTDIQEKRIYRYHLERNLLTNLALPDRLCSFAFTDKPGWLICAFAGGFALYNPETADIRWLAKPEAHLAYTRFNDGRIDRQGRFWAGSMAEKGGHHEASGNLYCLDHENGYLIKESKIRIPNSLSWSPDSRRMYFSDSLSHCIYQYDFDSVAGALSNKTIFAKTADTIQPDGSAVDADGYLWNAQWGGNQVVRYAPDGSHDLTLTVPCSLPTCCCFGGPDMQYLFVTSAREGLNEKALQAQPEAGNLFIYQTPFHGLIEKQYSLHTPP